MRYFPGWVWLLVAVVFAQQKDFLRHARESGARLIGLGLAGWEEEGGVQADLFGSQAPRPHPQDERLDETLDAIRRKFGKGYLQRGLSRRR